MQEITEAKLKLIREAVQDNLPRGPHSKIRLAHSLRRTRSWVPKLAFAMILACGLFSVVAGFSPRSAQPAANPPPPQPINTTADTTRPADAPAEAPRPLSRSMFPLSVRKIVVDPGHGGVQQGTASKSGIKEKDVTLQIGLRLRRLLQEESFDTLMTREEDKTVSLEKRAAFANDSHADLFVSIHINSIPMERVHPLETYFLGPTDDPQATRLATIENRDSDYSLADYRDLLERTYLNARSDESRRLATAVQRELFRSVRVINPSIEDRGVKTAPFAVLIHTEMPAILVEVSCLSNEEEAKLLTNEDYQENIAQALLSGIRSYARDLSGSKEKEAKNGTSD